MTPRRVLEKLRRTEQDDRKFERHGVLPLHSRASARVVRRAGHIPYPHGSTRKGPSLQ
jgi:hypothetical protein